MAPTRSDPDIPNPQPMLYKITPIDNMVLLDEPVIHAILPQMIKIRGTINFGLQSLSR